MAEETKTTRDEINARTATTAGNDATNAADATAEDATFSFTPLGETAVHLTDPTAQPADGDALSDADAQNAPFDAAENEDAAHAQADEHSEYEKTEGADAAQTDNAVNINGNGDTDNINGDGDAYIPSHASDAAADAHAARQAADDAVLAASERLRQIERAKKQAAWLITGMKALAATIALTLVLTWLHGQWHDYRLRSFCKDVQTVVASFNGIEKLRKTDDWRVRELPNRTLQVSRGDGAYVVYVWPLKNGSYLVDTVQRR